MGRTMKLIMGLTALGLMASILLVACGKATPTPTPKPAATPAPAVTPRPAATPSPTPAPTPVKKITWKMPGQLPLGYYSIEPTKQLAQRVTERSGGRLELTFHPAGELGYKGDESLRLLRDGVVPIVEVVGSWLEGEFPLFGGPMAPLLVQNVDESRKVYQATLGLLNRELAKKFNAQVLTLTSPGGIHVYSRPPLNKVEDFKGLKIRTAAPIDADFYKNLGASPITLIAAEVYPSIQRGVADAAIASNSAALGWKLQEVLKYAVILNYSIPTVVGYIASKPALEALPADLQQILLEEVKRAEDAMWANSGTADKGALEKLQQGGMQVIEFPAAERAKLLPAAQQSWENWRKSTGATADEYLQLARATIGR